MNPIKQRIYFLCLAVDQLCNVLLGGWPDETLSSRAFRMSGRTKTWTLAHNAIDTLLFFDTNHCEEAYINERQRRHLPPESR
jgi:hypothetical protein